MQRILLLLAVLSQYQCQTAELLISQFWIRGYNSLDDNKALATLTATSNMNCIAQASKVTGVQLIAFKSSTGVCGAYRNPQFVKCRDPNSENPEVWYLSTQVPGKCWTTVQHRVSGSVDFYRTWAEYKAGFGDSPSENFWIGLESLRQLTAVSSKIAFLMKAWNGSESWAQYSSFSVGPESDNYRMTVSGFTSSQSVIGDSFSGASGSLFTTKDEDNDGMSGNAAVGFHGAWWFNSASRSHMNGLYYTSPSALNTPFGQGLLWLDPFGSSYSLRETEMMVL